MNFRLKSYFKNLKIAEKIVELKKTVMEAKKFSLNGGLIVSTDNVPRVLYAAIRRGSAEVYGRYEVGRSYVVKVEDGKPQFPIFSTEEKDKIKVVCQGNLTLENGKYYEFLLIKVMLGSCRKLEKIKFRALREVTPPDEWE